MSAADQIRELLQKKREAGEILPKNHPSLDPVKKRVYEYVQNGHNPLGKEHKYVGATDEEMAAALPDIPHNSLRWARWSMTKDGYLVDSDIKRKVKRGVGKVWIAGDGSKPLKTEVKDDIDEVDRKVMQTLFDLCLNVVLTPSDGWPEEFRSVAQIHGLEFDPEKYRQRLKEF